MTTLGEKKRNKGKANFSRNRFTTQNLEQIYLKLFKFEMVHFKEHSKNSNQIVDINFKIGQH